jgi:DNA polymerase/3'-5' exonuclease PolX
MTAYAQIPPSVSLYRKTYKPLWEAKLFAERVETLLTPHCDRIIVAGSIRREMPEVSDIEIVCIPKAQTDLFGNFVHHDKGFLDAINTPLFRMNSNCEGKDNNNKYYRRQIPGYQVDIFCVTTESWAWKLMLRTGPTDFTMNIIEIFRAYGITSKDGVLLDKDHNPILVISEYDIFDKINLDYIPPKERC